MLQVASSSLDKQGVPKNAPTCFDLYSDHLQGARSFLVKVTEFKITKNIKGPLWQCGSVRVVCMYGVLCADASWILTRKL
jgi:hypothetical protein